MYEKAKRLTGQNNNKNKSMGIINEDGDLVTEPERIKNRWTQYVETLYDKAGKPSMTEMKIEKEGEIEIDNVGPELLKSEVMEAIKYMTNNKAEGVDGVPAEFLKSLGQEATEELIKLCRDIYEQGVWPMDFTKVIMIPLPKKANATACSDFRTISLIPHVSKILLRILMRRIEGKARDIISKTQFGFREGVGTREALV